MEKLLVVAQLSFDGMNAAHPVLRCLFSSLLQFRLEGKTHLQLPWRKRVGRRQGHVRKVHRPAIKNPEEQVHRGCVTRVVRTRTQLCSTGMARMKSRSARDRVHRTTQGLRSLSTHVMSKLVTVTVKMKPRVVDVGTGASPPPQLVANTKASMRQQQAPHQAAALQPANNQGVDRYVLLVNLLRPREFLRHCPVSLSCNLVFSLVARRSRKPKTCAIHIGGAAISHSGS